MLQEKIDKSLFSLGFVLKNISPQFIYEQIQYNTLTRCTSLGHPTKVFGFLSSVSVSILFISDGKLTIVQVCSVVVVTSHILLPKIKLPYILRTFMYVCSFIVLLCHTFLDLKLFPLYCLC